MSAPHAGIAGAGVAGLALAVMLRRRGWRVTVAERFAAPAPVGSGLMLQPTGLAVLRALGLDPRAHGYGAPVTRLLGKRADDGRKVLDVGYAAGRAGPALGIHRSALFGLLHRAAVEAGAEFETGFEVDGVEAVAAGATLVAGGRRLGPFPLVVDALGARSPLGPAFGSGPRRALAYGALWGVAPWPGAPFAADALEQRYRRASTMIGVLPAGPRWGETAPTATVFWSLRAEDHEAWRSRGVDAWRREVERAWPEVSPVLDAFRKPQDLAFARYSHHTVRRPIAPGLAAIGDAAHSTSPQLGQGANMALLDAAALADALGEGVGDLDRALRRYARRRWAHVRLYQALSRVFTPLYQSDSRWPPMIRDHVLRPLALAPFAPPILAATVSGRLLTQRDPLAWHIGHTM